MHNFTFPISFKSLSKLSEKTLFFVIIMLAALLAGWMQYIQHGWINPDTVIYFEQARLISQGEFMAAYKVFNWPFYGACIALVHKVLPTSIHVSAQLLNMLFFTLATAGFLRIIKLCGGDRLDWIAGAALLFSTHYIVGDVLEMLMRDEGFWAFYLMGIAYLIRFFQQHKFRDALLWQIFIIIATLFRIEGVMYLLLVPILYYTYTRLYPEKNQTTLRKLSLSYCLCLILAGALVIFLLANPQYSIQELGRMREVFSNQALQAITEHLFTQSKIMSELVLGKYLAEYALISLLVTFLLVMIIKSVTTSGVIALFFAGYTIKHKNLINSTAYKVLLVTAVVCILCMLLTIIKVFVLSSRYVVPLVWIILIFASLSLKTLFSSNTKFPKLIMLIIILTLSLSFIKNILPKRAGYNYMQDAVTWLKQHDLENKEIYYNERRLFYYAGNGYMEYIDKPWQAINIKLAQGQHYDYLVLANNQKRRGQEEQVMKQFTKYQEIKRFYDAGKKHYVVIYESL